MTFTDEDLKRLKENLIRFGVDPGIDICNYFDEVYEIAGLVARLEAAEAVIKEADDHGFSDKAIELETAWRKAAGK